MFRFRLPLVRLHFRLPAQVRVIALYISALALLTSITACAIKVEEKQGPLGKEASGNSVNQELFLAMGDSSILNAQKNQYVTYEGNYRLEQFAVVRSYQKTLTLSDRKEDDIEIKFILTNDFESFKYDGTSNGRKISEMPALIWDKSVGPGNDMMAKAAQAMKDVRKAAADPNACDGVDVTDEDGNVFDCIRFYKLQSRVYQADPPSLVKAKPNCMNIPDCKLTVHYVAFDRVKWKKGRAVVRDSLSYEVVQNIPDLNYNFLDDGDLAYYPPVLSFCSAGLTKLEGSLYYLSQCEVLRDFQ